MCGKDPRRLFPGASELHVGCRDPVQGEGHGGPLDGILKCLGIGAEDAGMKHIRSDGIGGVIVVIAADAHRQAQGYRVKQREKEAAGSVCAAGQRKPIAEVIHHEW